jgi:TolB-like protein/DNA-binding winged helix-turn-helix (wHTH) protein/Tfp pilus assembly protein PilF
MPVQSSLYRFGPYELRPRAREISKLGTKLKLRPQPFQVLKLLAERPGDIVTREELRKLLWSAETFVDFEQGLNTAVKELRALLNDSAENPRYIETVPKLGYRLVAPVEVVSLGEPHLPPVHVESPAAEIVRSEKGAGRRIWQMPAFLRWTAVAGIAVVLLTGLTGYWQRSREPVNAQPAGGKLMLAVLPFENLTGDEGQDYFSDGLTEEMISQLGRIDIQHMGVIARTSVMHYKQSRSPLEQIGRELGVQYVLEGSVRREADKVRISAQLIQMRDHTHLWSRQYDRELSSLLALQSEIAQEITDEIQLTLGDHERVAADRKPAASPSSYEAYDVYLKGRYFWNKRTTAGFQQAAEYFQQAIAKDPNYAPAYAGLADTFALMSSYSIASPNEIMPKARAAALRALQIDDTLAEAHTSLALITENYDWDWQTAEKEYRRAIQLDPNYATAHQWYAEYLTWLGRFDDAFRESERARQLDPLSLIIATDYGASLYFSRQYDRAIDEFHTVLAMEPSFPRANMVMFAHVEKGMFAEALDDIEKWRRIDDTPYLWAEQAYVYGRSGQQEQARHALKKFEEWNRRGQPRPTPEILLAYIAVNRKDEALAWLQKASVEHSSVLITIKVEPAFDPLRSDPRFRALLHRVGLTE